MSLPTRTKLSFGFGSLAFGIKDQGFNTLLMLYYNQVIGLSAAYVGTAILIATLLDAVLDPLIGQASDHWRSKLGRRHPFMYASALPMAIAYLLVWAPPEGSTAVQMVWLTATSIIVRIAVSLYEIPSSALVAELTRDYNERTALATWRSLFMAIALVGMSIVVFKCFLVPTPEQPVGQLNAAGYVQYSYLAAALIFLSVIVAARGTHHCIQFLQASITERHGNKLLSNVRLLLSDRAYVSVVLCIFFFAVAGGVATTLGTYVNTYFWKLTASQLGTLAGGLGLGVVFGLVVAASVRGLNKKTVTITAYAIALLAFLTLVTLRLSGCLQMSVEALMPWLVAQTALMSACVLVAVIMGTSMLADVADHIEEKTDRRMEGLMFAALIMIQKAVSGMGVFFSGVFLSLVGFPDKADPATIDPAIVNHMALVYVLALGIMVALALISISLYPITRESQARTVEALRLRRSQALISASA